MPTAAARSLYRPINFNKVLFHNSDCRFRLLVPSCFPVAHEWPGTQQNQVLTEKREQPQKSPSNVVHREDSEKQTKIINSSLSLSPIIPREYSIKEFDVITVRPVNLE